MRVITRQSYDAPPAPRVDVAVLFDIFRASTTLAALLSRQPAEIVATNDEKTARSLAAVGHVLISEVFRGGLDNSPTKVLAAELAGKKIVHKSTNMTNDAHREQQAVPAGQR